MLRRLDMLDLEVDVVLSGGIFKGNSARLIAMATERIIQHCPKVRVCPLQVPPVVGAVLLAFDACGLSVPAIQLGEPSTNV